MAQANDVAELVQEDRPQLSWVSIEGLGGVQAQGS